MNVVPRRCVWWQVPPVEWLDRVSLPYMSRVLSELSNQRRSQCWLPSSDSPASSAAADKEEMLFGSAHLVLTLPIFHLPVLYEEKAYPGRDPAPLAYPSLSSNHHDGLQHPSMESC